MTLIATSNKPDSSFIKQEMGKNLSRKTVTYNGDAEVTLRKGTVLGAVTADGKYRVAVETAVDGSENFAGIFVATPDNADSIVLAAATDYEIVVLNQDALVAYEGLTIDASYDQPAEIAALKDQMEAVGIRIAENRPTGPFVS